ncbi:DUF2142 domain-containing protein [Glaciihabitans sp. GrIS 2.15]|uniref:DUF2142 domain-containing protein n=1 Tax=Glaciihabitans sp. GrIS 2.15 TaxID=3071710 RepID=UPI002E0E27A7
MPRKLETTRGAAEESQNHMKSGGWPRWRVFVVAWVLLSALAVCWSIATPISGAPDEPAHIIKAAAVARGEIAGKPSPTGQVVHVPQYIAHTPALTCYAFHPQVLPTCSAAPTGDQWKTVRSTTSAGLYNPLYYAVVGWPSLIFHDDSGVYAMRIVSGLISSLFLAVTLMLIWTWQRRWLPVLGFAVAATPMVFFLDGVVNPNSLETTATLAAFTAVLSIIRSPHPRLLTERATIAMVSAAVAVNMRGLSPLWVAIAVLAPFLLVSWSETRELAKKREVKIAIVVIAIAAVVAVAWIALSNSLAAGLTAPQTAVSGLGVGASPLRGFEEIFVGTFDYGQGIVGEFGWLDTPAPTPVFFVWSAFIAALFVAGVVFLRGRSLVFALTLIGGIVLLPPLTQAVYITGGGIIWQGRYALPLFVCVVLGLAKVLSERMPVPEGSAHRRLVGLVLTAWGLAQFYSFAVALKRYAVGASLTSWKKLLVDPTWSPPGGTILILALTAVVVVVATLMLKRLAGDSEAATKTAGLKIGL